LYTEIKDQYDRVLKHVQIGNKKRDVGEIDLLCLKGNHVDLYEVKCSFRITKARKQLTKLRKFFDYDNTNMFFYCGMAQKLVAIE